MQHNPDWYNVSLKIFLINQKGELLALKAAPTGSMAGFYDFPGGRINDDEFNTPYEILIQRELAEEIGAQVKYELRLKPVSFSHHAYYSQRQGKEIRLLWLCFEAKYLGGEINISQEHADYKWLDLQQINLEDYFTAGPLEAVKRYLEFGG